MFLRQPKYQSLPCQLQGVLGPNLLRPYTDHLRTDGMGMWVFVGSRETEQKAASRLLTPELAALMPAVGERGRGVAQMQFFPRREKLSGHTSSIVQDLI